MLVMDIWKKNNSTAPVKLHRPPEGKEFTCIGLGREAKLRSRQIIVLISVNSDCFRSFQIGSYFFISKKTQPAANPGFKPKRETNTS